VALEQRVDADLELAQLGLFVQVIDHEFVHSIKEVRRAIGRLGDLGKDNPAIARVYQSVRMSFDALDGYLKLFTPLQRRAYRNNSVITGRRLYNNLKLLFAERFSKETVELRATAGFLDHHVKVYPSTLFPVFVNILDNALFWLRSRPQKEILLSLDGEALLVSNNGTPIPKKDREFLFEPAFSRKPDGRGLGLWIAQQALHRDGFRLMLRDDPVSGMTVTFAVEPLDPGETAVDKDRSEGHQP
jgi:signal transduction histidine kinase